MTASITQHTTSKTGVPSMSLPREAASSITSYGVGSCGIVTGLLDQAHALTIVLGVLLLIIRLIYDSVRLYRFLIKTNSSASD